MKSLLTMLAGLMVLTVSAQAQVPSTLLSKSLERSSAVQAVRSDLETAQGKLERLVADNLSTKLEVLEARQLQDAAQRAVLRVQLEQISGLTRDLYAWRSAQDAAELGRLRLTLAGLQARAAKLRFQAGAINAVDLARTEDETRTTEAEVRRLEAGVSAGAGALMRRLGTLPPATLLLEAVPRPERRVLEAALTSHPRVAEARSTIERAGFEVALKDNEFSPQIERTQVRQALARAEQRLSETRSEVKSALDAAWDGYTSAQGAIQGAERAVDQARDSLAAQRLRLSRGTVSQLQVLQSQITLKAAQNSLSETRSRLALSVLELAAAAQVDLWTRR